MGDRRDVSAELKTEFKCVEVVRGLPGGSPILTGRVSPVKSDMDRVWSCIKDASKGKNE